MAARTALVIDDEPQIRRIVRHVLADDFTRILEAESGSAGIDLAAAERPALIVLDLGLPDTTGIEVCIEIRKWSDAVILVLSARHADHEKVSVLDAGVDDYVTKPFSTNELKARVRALLRRGATRGVQSGTTIHCGELKMDLDARTLLRNEKLVHLTPTEWELLRVLMSHGGKTMTHRQFFAAVWPGRSAGDAQQYLRVYVANVRRKIEANPLERIDFARRAGFLLAIVALTACSDRSALERQARAATTQRLIGTWDVHFHLDHPLASGPGFGSVERDVDGQIAFLANRWLTRTYPLMNVASDYGVFDVDFSPLGFDARRNNETPTAVAGWQNQDSVQIILGDPETEIAVTMGGRARGDSIVGTWRVWISRAGGGGGHFVMVRHR